MQAVVTQRGKVVP